MCILIHHPINTKFTVDQLQDFYDKNSDGFGAIVKHGDTVEVIKSIGQISEIIELYNEQVSGKEAIIHLRMKTHGDIDLNNCHPYEVIPGLYMAHNGILSTGNSKDTRMSDTWHYINDFLRPILKSNPDMIFNPGFQAMISSHIGPSNKFGFMNSSGKAVIINKTSGVTHKGVWYSNTYAWTPWKFGLGQQPVATTHSYTPANRYSKANQGSIWDSRYASSSTWKAWDQYDRAPDAKAKTKYHPLSKKAKAAQTKKITNIDTEQLKRIIRQTYNAINLDGQKSVKEWVNKYPMAAMRLIYELYGSESSAYRNSTYISDLVNDHPWDAADWICEAWENMEVELCQLADIKIEHQLV